MATERDVNAQPSESRLYFRQLLAGRDFARGDAAATQMVNFVYLIGDRAAGRCLIVDPAWNTEELVALAAADDMEIEGVLATHFHPDHVGGDLFGTRVPGISELLETHPCKIHCNTNEVEWIRRMTGVSEGDLSGHASGDVVQIGAIEVRLVHTPGHTPGSQCFLVEGRLVAGDTLFLQGCGRTDFPGGDKAEIYKSITQRLAKLPDDTLLYPGHLYDPRAFATLGETRATNYVFQVPDLETWQQMV